MTACGHCGMDVLPGGNHAAVNHPGGATTPFDWRPAYWRQSNLDREARRKAAKDEAATAAPASVVVTGYKATSFDAWVASLPTLRETERGILDLLNRYGPLTDEQLYDAYTVGRPEAYRNTVLPTRTGLYKKGYVKDTGQKRQVKSGRTAIIWGLNL